MNTHYDKLGVTRHASYADIEQTYRHRLSEHLVDNRKQPIRKNDLLQLQQMRQAYLTLSSPGRRREYDLQIDQMEHARLRKIERVGTGIGLAMLIAGLTLIARGYYQQVYDDTPVAQVVERATDAADTVRENTVLVSRAKTALVTAQAD